MKKYSLLLLFAVLLCSCQKEESLKLQSIKQSDCLESERCTWNVTAVKFNPNAEYEYIYVTNHPSLKKYYLGHVTFVSGLEGDLNFTLSVSDDYESFYNHQPSELYGERIEKALYIQSHSDKKEGGSTKELMSLTNNAIPVLPKSYSVRVNKKNEITIYGFGVTVDNIMIVSDDYNEDDF